jgi:hypothetical protein
MNADGTRIVICRIRLCSSTFGVAFESGRILVADFSNAAIKHYEESATERQ